MSYLYWNLSFYLAVKRFSTAQLRQINNSEWLTTGRPNSLLVVLIIQKKSFLVLEFIYLQIMIERSLQQSLAKPVDIGVGGRGGAVRPTNLPTERRMSHRSSLHLVSK